MDDSQVTQPMANSWYELISIIYNSVLFLVTGIPCATVEDMLSFTVLYNIMPVCIALLIVFVCCIKPRKRTTKKLPKQKTTHKRKINEEPSYSSEDIESDTESSYDDY